MHAKVSETLPPLALNGCQGPSANLYRCINAFKSATCDFQIDILIENASISFSSRTYI